MLEHLQSSKEHFFYIRKRDSNLLEMLVALMMHVVVT